MNEFVHLHLHSEYSLLDGACRVSDIPEKAASMGHSAVAITDHGVMYGAVEFYLACKKAGVKPIIGCEVYVASGSRFSKNGKQDMFGDHLVLLCKNETGYKNLIYLVSLGFTEGFYSKPRIDLELLEGHCDGLVALSACVAGKIPRSILAGDFAGAENYALKLDKMFGRGSFYLEVQNHGIADERLVGQELLKISKKHGIPLVATNDVHYIEKSDAETQAVLMCVQTNSVITDGRPLGFENDEFYYKTTEEMQELFAEYPDAVSNTTKIADMCNFDFSFGELHLPRVSTSTKSAHELLREYTYQGLYKRIGSGDISGKYGTLDEYKARIEYELQIINKMGFDDYFLIVRDFTSFAREKDIPVGPGRGSGAGSMVAFCIGITGIDPFEYGLIFERFLNPERISMPDFDIDFCYERREEIIQYVKEKYGHDRVAQIVTFGTLAPRAAVRDVGRALSMPYNEIDRVAELIPRSLGVTFDEAMKNPALQSLYNESERVKKLIDIARNLEGMPRHASTHAAGIVITEKSVNEYVPLSVNGGSVVVQYDMNVVSKLGLVKFDFLGLRYLTIISDAQKQINERYPDFSIENIPYNDEKTYKLISAGKTEGVFQLESYGIRQVLMEMAPENIYDLTAAIALYRPGPMASIPTYISRRHGKELVKYELPQLEKILKETYGCIVYQEQVMQIFRTLAGYSLARADNVRRAMAKKESEKLKSEEESFIYGATKNGIEKETAKKIFSEMLSFASYAFNKSHAAAYAVLSYRTAYLKAHYGAEYMSAMMTSVLGNVAKIKEYTSECSKMGISVLRPDINESQAGFSVVDRNIRFALLAVKGIGKQLIDEIVKERRSVKAFSSFEDFVKRTSKLDINKRQLESLIKAGVFDSLGVSRSALLHSYSEIADKYSSSSNGNVSGQIDFFSAFDAVGEEKFAYPEIDEFNIKELLLLEKESLGMYFSGHMLDNYASSLSTLKPDRIIDIIEEYSGNEDTRPRTEKKKVRIACVINTRRNKTTKNGSQMAFLTVEDYLSEINVIVFSRELERYGDILRPESIIYMEATVTPRDEGEPELILVSARELGRGEQENGTPDVQASSVTAKATAQYSKIYVKLDFVGSELWKRALAIADENKGDVELLLFSQRDKKYYSAKNQGVNSASLGKLVKAFGEDNVVAK